MLRDIANLIVSNLLFLVLGIVIGIMCDVGARFNRNGGKNNGDG